jgi:hypothetical protein
MAELWSWLAIAGLGALHGVSPANGWALAAACGLRSRNGADARRALWPIGLGQAASIGVLVRALSLGRSVDRGLMRDLAVTLLVAAAAWWCWRRRSVRPRTRPTTTAGQAGIALWSFLLASAQGAGLMLIPTLGPLCAPGAPVRELVSGALATGLAAVVVHSAAMLLTTGLLASAAVAAQKKFLPGDRR